VKQRSVSAWWIVAPVVCGAFVASCTAPRARFVHPTSSPTGTISPTVTATFSQTWYPSFSPSLTSPPSNTPSPFPTAPVNCGTLSCTVCRTYTVSPTSPPPNSVTRTLTPTPTLTPLGGGTPTLTPFVLYDEPF